MATLQDLRKRKFKTVKAFAEAWGCSPSTGSHILNGRHHLVFTRDEIQRLADLLGVTFDECVKAADESFCKEHNSTMRDDKYWRLENLWRQREQTEEKAKEWAENWIKYGRGRVDPFGSIRDEMFSQETPLTIFGLQHGATQSDVMNAFRKIVKARADGNGGYTGDMDALVQAKEKALAFLQRRLRTEV